MSNIILKYLIKSSDSYPCFVWPVVEKDGELQLVLSNGQQTITSFRKIDDLRDFEIAIPVPTPDSDVKFTEESPTVFAYAFDENRYFYGTFGKFSEEIKSFLQSNPEAVGTDVFKQYALYAKIKADALIDKLLVGILENETDSFLRDWACSKIREHKQNRVCLPLPNKYNDPQTKLYPTVNYLKTILKRSGISFLVELAKELTDRPLLPNEDVLERERKVHGGYVNILTADLQKTELAEDVLDAMADNMKDTAYKFCFSQSSVDYSDVIYEIKARVLERNIAINTKERFEFFDISEVPYASELQNILRNVIFWECEKEGTASYLLMVKKNVWENSVSMEPLGNRVGYIPLPLNPISEIFDYFLNHEKTQKIAA